MSVLYITQITTGTTNYAACHTAREAFLTGTQAPAANNGATFSLTFVARG